MKKKYIYLRFYESKYILTTLQVSIHCLKSSVYSLFVWKNNYFEFVEIFQKILFLFQSYKIENGLTMWFSNDKNFQKKTALFKKILCVKYTVLIIICLQICKILFPKLIKMLQKRWEIK